MQAHLGPIHDARKREWLLEINAQHSVEECQLWSETIDRTGYGRIWFGGQWRLAHDVMWEVVNGRLPDHLTLDHYIINVAPEACSRACINVLHLEPVTSAENTLRGRGMGAQQARKTHCIAGHLLAGENISAAMLKRGRRVCLVCKRLKEAERQAQKRVQEVYSHHLERLWWTN